MKLKLKNTPEQVELVRAMGSKDAGEAREAQEAFAAFLGPVVQQVLLQAGSAGAIFSDAPFDEDDSPSFPLDLYYGESENHVPVLTLCLKLLKEWLKRFLSSKSVMLGPLS
jgi:hypothetical protein